MRGDLESERQGHGKRDRRRSGRHRLQAEPAFSAAEKVSNHGFRDGNRGRGDEVRGVKRRRDRQQNSDAELLGKRHLLTLRAK